MSFWAKLALGVCVLAFLCASVAVVFVAKIDPTFRGLRPHAVRANLAEFSIPELVASSQHPPVRGVLVRDAWFEREGGTGWVLIEGAQLKSETLRFRVSGALETALGRIFSPNPVECNGTQMPEKAVIAYEPARTGGGFTGRSTCRRVKMDVRDLMETGTAVRYVVRTQLPHRELRDVLARGDVLPFAPKTLNDTRAFTRRVKLPIVAVQAGAFAFEIESDLRAAMKAQSWPEGVSWTLKMSDPRQTDGAASLDDAYVLKIGEERFALSRDVVKLYRPEVTFICALAADASCAEVFPPRAALDRVRSARGEDFVLSLKRQANPAQPDDQEIWDQQLGEDRMVDFLVREATYAARWFERL